MAYSSYLTEEILPEIYVMKRRVDRVLERRRKKAAYNLDGNGLVPPGMGIYNQYLATHPESFQTSPSDFRIKTNTTNTTTTTPKKVEYIKTNPTDNTRVVQNLNVDLGTPDAQYRLGNITKEQKDFFEYQLKTAAIRNYYGITAPENATISQGRDYSQEERDYNEAKFLISTPYYREKALKNAAVLGTAMTLGSPTLAGALWNPASTVARTAGLSGSWVATTGLTDAALHSMIYAGAAKNAWDLYNKNRRSLKNTLNNDDGSFALSASMLIFPFLGKTSKSIKTLSPFLQDVYKTSRFNIANRGTGVSMPYPWENFSPKTEFSLTNEITPFRGTTTNTATNTSKGAFLPGISNFENYALPFNNTIKASIENKNRIAGLLEPPLVSYTENGEFFPNPYAYYRMGDNLIERAIEKGVIDVLSEKQPKYHNFNLAKDFNTPFFKNGGLWYKHGTAQDLIVTNRSHDINWQALSKEGGFVKSKNQRSNRTTPLIDGKPNKFPTKDTQLYRFNINSGRYEPYTELDWNHWLHHSIDDNVNRKILQSHLGEYYDIEKNAKVDGTWLKMPDGSIWQFDPRSWVQLMSTNGQQFSKDVLFSGLRNEFNPNYNGIFWATRGTGKAPAMGARQYSVFGDDGVLQLVVPKDLKTYNFNANGEQWRKLSSLPSDFVEMFLQRNRYSPQINRTNDIVDFLFDNTYFQRINIDNVIDPGSHFPPRNSKYYFEQNLFSPQNDVIINKNIPRKSIMGNNGDFNLGINNYFKQYGGRV